MRLRSLSYSMMLTADTSSSFQVLEPEIEQIQKQRRGWKSMTALVKFVKHNR